MYGHKIRRSDSKTWVRRPENAKFKPQYTRQTHKHDRENIIVWGFFPWYGLGLIFWIKENIGQPLYAKILEDVMLSYEESTK